MKALLASVALLAGAPGLAAAATLSGASSGVFTAEDASDSVGCFRTLGCVGTDEAGISGGGDILFWPYRVCDGTCDPDIDRSTLSFLNYAIDPVTLAPGDYLVRVGKLRWFNASSSVDHTPAEFNALATMTIGFTQPSATSYSQGFRFNIVNTANADTQGADEIRLSPDGGAFQFAAAPVDLGGGMSLTGFSFSEHGDGSLQDGVWRNPEDSLSFLRIEAHITVAADGGQTADLTPPSEVPLPPAGWLLLAALGTLAARRKANPAG